MFPRRGALALITTLAGLALLLNFKTSDVASDTLSLNSVREADPRPGLTASLPVSSSSGSGTDASPADVKRVSRRTADGSQQTAAREGSSSGGPAPTAEVPPSPASAQQDAAQTADAPPADGAIDAVATRSATGAVVRTPDGDIQVAVTADASGIADVQPIQMPGPHFQSRRISQIVEPILRREALQAQGAEIDWISGATYTSQGYAMSLQSALDRLG
jgi:uncharacterized protein with FMN-binding domain